MDKTSNTGRWLRHVWCGSGGKRPDEHAKLLTQNLCPSAPVPNGGSIYPRCAFVDLPPLKTNLFDRTICLGSTPPSPPKSAY